MNDDMNDEGLAKIAPELANEVVRLGMRNIELSKSLAQTEVLKLQHSAVIKRLQKELTESLIFTEDVINSLREFCNRVDIGEVRSTITYRGFKRHIDKWEKMKK